MKTFVDCVPCIMKQAVAAPRRFTEDESLVAEIVRRTARLVSEFDMTRPPPEMGGEFNRIMAQVLGVEDPYYSEKNRSNAAALSALPQLRRMVGESDDPFVAAVKLSSAGNIIDFGAPGGRTDSALFDQLATVIYSPIGGGGEGAIAELRDSVSKADSILFLADNAGEIVIDTLLVEQLPKGKVTVAVRSGPAINDALLADAKVAGMGELATLVESGVAVPGTPMGRTSPEFRALFESADVIISKGQGNYETLSERSEPIFFLLMAKCELVASQLECKVGDRMIVAPRASTNGREQSGG